MKIDKKLEVMLSKKVELERLKIEAETIKNWKEKVEIIIKKSNDYKSLETYLKNLLQAMENRLRILQTQMKDLI